MSQSQDKDKLPSEADVISRIVTLLQKETEYPVEVLKPEKKLETELGIDSITQADVMAAIRKELANSYKGGNLPVEEEFRLRDYPTIQSWAEYLIKRLK